uniref:Uncharacterized protein n=1 Tax=Haemonchus placei TaxID=6290 RepID=A0A0N4W350_HAEPC
MSIHKTMFDTLSPTSGTQTTVTAQNINSVGRTPFLSLRSIAGSLASRKETQALKTSLSRNAPSPSTTPSYSAPSNRIRKSPPAALRRNLNDQNRQLSVAFRPSIIENCRLGGYLLSGQIACGTPECSFV